MDKIASAKQQQRRRAAQKSFAGRRKAEVVLRVMNGEDAHDVAEAMGVSVTEIETWRREFVIAGERRMGELPLGLLERCFSPFERLVPLASLVSVALAVFLFVQGQRRDREARERETARAREQRVTESFNALDDKYIDYVKLCLEHPELDVFDIPIPHAASPSPEVRRREGMMFAILISVLERSYLMYRDQTDPFKREQWAGWEAYIVKWLERPNFVEEWQRTKKEFDADFARYMDGLIARKRP
jgi:hypothetical protein